MDKFLHLKFKNAKLIDFNKKSKRDKWGGRIFQEPITKHQISNVIRCLWGERPIPTLRTVVYANLHYDNYYMVKAENSYLEISSVKAFNKKSEMGYISETIQTNKDKHDSWNPNVYVNWELIKNYCDIYFNEIIKDLSTILGYDPTTTPFTYLCEKIKDKDLSELYEKLVKYKLTALKNILCGGGSYGALATKPKPALHNVRGVGTFFNFEGDIFIPINDNDIKRISEGSGSSRILDGGLIWICRVVDDFLDDGFVKVKDISTKKFEKPNKKPKKLETNET